jgi:hypothetical protein
MSDIKGILDYKPVRAKSKTYKLRLVHADGRFMELGIEPQWPTLALGDVNQRFSLTTRRRWYPGKNNSVTAMPWNTWARIQDEFLASANKALDDGLVLYRDKAQAGSATISIVEDSKRIDFQPDSYRLEIKTPNGTIQTNWTDLADVRIRFAQEIAKHSPPSLPTPPMEPTTIIGSGDVLLKWTALHFIGPTSDKVYAVELWRRGTAYFVSVRHGRRCGTLKRLLKIDKVSLGHAQQVYEETVEEKLGKGYKVRPAKNISVDQPDSSGLPDVGANSAPTTPDASQASVMPPGVVFWCEKCNKRVYPTEAEKQHSAMTFKFSFACHGVVASRNLSQEAMVIMESRASNGLGAQQINIFLHDGKTAPGATHLAGTPFSMPHINLPPPTTVTKPKKQPTVNDPPPSKVGTMVPAALGIQQFGKRKVRFAVED